MGRHYWCLDSGLPPSAHDGNLLLAGNGVADTLIHLGHHCSLDRLVHITNAAQSLYQWRDRSVAVVKMRIAQRIILKVPQQPPRTRLSLRSPPCPGECSAPHATRCCCPPGSTGEAERSPSCVLLTRLCCEADTQMQSVEAFRRREVHCRGALPCLARHQCLDRASHSYCDAALRLCRRCLGMGAWLARCGAGGNISTPQVLPTATHRRQLRRAIMPEQGAE